MALSALQTSHLSRLFSPSVLREMARRGRSSLFTHLLRDAGLVDLLQLEGATVGTAFDAAFSALRRAGTRSEYVYRTALTKNVLLGRHSLRTASMLTEFRAGSSKADLVILNGTATAYEIKSDRDSLARLSSQIENYRKVFSKIYVIAGEAHIDELVSATPRDIGIMSLARWDRIHTVREAEDLSASLCAITIFESLRASEAKEVLSNLNVSISDAPNTMIHAMMRKCFEQLSAVEVQASMVQTLKRTRNLASLQSLVDNLPMSLHSAALSLQLRATDRTRLVNTMQNSITEAMAWA